MSANTQAFVFDDIFHELIHDLEIDAKDWHVNHSYLNFPDVDSTTETDNNQHSSPSTKENNDDDFFFSTIPEYLSTSSSSFRMTFMSELHETFNSVHILKDLQQLTLLSYSMSIIRLHQQLWHRCLQCGTGLLKQREQESLLSSLSTSTASSSPRSSASSPPLSLSLLLSAAVAAAAAAESVSQSHMDIKVASFWPDIVTSAMMSQGILDAQHRSDQIDPTIYINFIQNYLYRLEKKFKQCQLQFETIKDFRSDSIKILDDKIDHFVQSEAGLSAMRQYFQIQMTLIDYIYLDRLYQYAYFQQKPTNLQLQIAQNMCCLIFEKEKAQQEMILFKFGRLFKRLPKSLELLEDYPPTSITTIPDSDLRNRLSNDYQRIIQEAKDDLMNVLARAYDAKKDDCQQKWDREMTDIWQIQRQLPNSEQLTKMMTTFIEQRQKNIIECLKRVYHLKDNWFHKVPPPLPTQQ